MEPVKYFFVEHFVQDKKGWDGWMANWFDIYGAEDMTVDKAKAYPEWEGNECLMTIPSNDGMMTICLWKMPHGTTIDEFQMFTDRFCCGYATNKVFEVEQTFGIKNLDVRGYFRDFINAAQGRLSPGYLDDTNLWMVHHHFDNRQAWEKDVADQINKTCNTPSDCQSIFKVEKCCLTLFFTNNDAVGFNSFPEGFTMEDAQKAKTHVTKGLAKTDIYLLDPDNGINAFQLSEDNWSQDALTWAEGYVKTLPVDAATATMTTPIGIAASQ